MVQARQALDEEKDQFVKYWDKQYRAGSWPAFEREREAFAGKLSSITMAPKKQSQKTERANTLHQLEQHKINMDKHYRSEPDEYNLVPKTAFNERIEADQKKI